MRETKLLTRSEFQVMSILWNLPNQQGNTGDILEQIEEPKPAYTTLATFLKILHRKGFVTFRKNHNRLVFKPKVSKETYAKTYLDPGKKAFFNDNTQEMLRFIIEDSTFTAAEAAELTSLIQQKVK